MSILTSDLKFLYSAPAATAGNQLSQSNPTASLGKFVSTTVWVGGTLNDLFGLLSGNANALRQVDYRCLFIANKNGSLTWQAPVLWLPSQVAGNNIAIGVDPAPAALLAAMTAQAAVISQPTGTPAGVTFSAPSDQGSGLALGDIPAGYCRAFWVRRTAIDSAAVTNAGFSISAYGDSA
jgi:hypothetical protein